MLNDATLSVQALVDLLERRQPSALNRIRDTYPDYRAMLQPGKMLGAHEASQDQLLADLLRSTVGVARQESLATYELVARRLKTSARLRLWSSIVSAASSGGLIATLMQNQHRGALIAGGVAFVSSCFMLVAQYLEDYAGGRDSLRGMRDRVVAHVAESAQVEGELKLMEARGAFEQAEAMIRKLNTLVASLREVQLAVS